MCTCLFDSLFDYMVVCCVFADLFFFVSAFACLSVCYCISSNYLQLVYFLFACLPGLFAFLFAVVIWFVTLDLAFCFYPCDFKCLSILVCFISFAFPLIVVFARALAGNMFVPNQCVSAWLYLHLLECIYEQ